MNNNQQKKYNGIVHWVVVCATIIIIASTTQLTHVFAAVSDPVNFRLDAGKTSVEVGEEFIVNLMIDSPVREVTAAEISIKFPTDNFEISDIEPGITLPEALGAANIDLDTGTLTITRGSTAGTLFKGSGTVAQLTFKATKSSTSNLTFLIDTSKTRVAGKGTETQNLLGTVTSVSVKVNPANFVTDLTGSNEVPPVTTQANGTASVKLNDAETSFTVNLNFAGITGQTAAHIHGPADPDGNAPVLYTLPTGQMTNHSFQASRLAEGVTFDQLLQVLKDGTAYINIHTSAHPDGEIRGHLLTSWMKTSQTSFLRSDFGGLSGVPDQKVDLQDLNILINEFYVSSSSFKADIIKTGTSNNRVDIQDYNAFVNDFIAYRASLQ